MRPRPTSRSDGFTLIEVVMVTILMGIIGLLSFLFIATGVSGFVSTAENTTLAQKAGLAMARITAELTQELDGIEVIVPPTGMTTYIKYRSRSALSGYRHIALMGAGVRKEIKIVDRNTLEPQATDTSVLIDGVSAFTLTYKKSDDTAWAVADGMDALARVEISLTVFTDDTGADTRTFETFVAMPKRTGFILTRWTGRTPAGDRYHG